MSYIGNLPFGKTLRTVTSATANGSATVFYPDGGYDVNFVDVFVSGARLTSGLDYTASDGISITLLYTPADGDTIDMVAYGLLELVSPVFPVSVSVGSNVVINTSSISVGNSSVNTQIVAGNVTLNGSTLKVGNSSVNTVITGNSVTIGGTLTVTGNVALTTNSVNSSMLTTTGVIANSYGNTTAIPVITVDAAGRITNATTSSVSGVTGLSFAPANSTVTVSTSTTNFDAAITSGNDSVQGLLKVIDSVSNTSTLIAGSANSVTTAYLLAANAVSNATAYAATAYSNAVATAASDATTKAGTAYSNAVAIAASDATSKAGTAYSNATAYADTKAGTAYSNAVATAASDATTKAGTAYSNATAYADTKAGTAYSNAISYANTAAGTAYSNAASYADTKAAAAYSNVFNGGTFSGAVVMQANLTANSVRMNGDLQIDGNLTVLGNTVSIHVSTLSVEDNMIYLNSNSTVSNPDLGFAGNYNDGTYAHAGLFRDATDGVWKFFHGYTPEPDASVYIDTSNASFTFSNLQINYVIGNVTGSANSATYLGGNTAATLRSYSDTMAGTAYSNATTYAATIAGTAYSNAVSVAASDATTKAGTAYSNATTYAATIAGTAYSNATAFAANASNISSGTLSASRLPATYLTAESDTLATVTGRGSTTNGAITISSGTTDQGLTMTVSDAGWNYIGFSHGATRKAYFGLDGSGNPQWGSDSGAFSITGNYTTIGTSARSPLFYDSDDTTYYLDPNSTTSAILAGSIGLGTTSPVNTAWGTASTTKQITIYGSNYGVLNIRGDLATAAHYSLGVGGTRYYAAYDNVATVHRMVFFGDYTGFNGVVTPSYNIHLSGTGYATADWRAPIFYDSNDTAYSVDPATTSRLKELKVGTGTFGSSGASLYIQGNYNWRWIAGFAPDYGVGNGFGLYSDTLGAYLMSVSTSGYFYFGSNDHNSSYKLSVGGTGYATSDFRSPIFYDSNDTGYYGDFAGASVFNSASYVGNINFGTATTQAGPWTISPIGSGGATPATKGTGYGRNLIVKAGNSDNGGGLAGGDLYLRAGAPVAPATVYGVVYLSDDGGYTQAGGSMRAPLFYDSNNTTYYTDPASTSNMYNITVRAGSAYAAVTDLGFVSPIQVSETGTGTSSDRYVPMISGTSTSPSGYRQHTVFGSLRGTVWGSAFIAVGGNDSYPTVAYTFHYDGYGTAPSSWRAPIFYDSNNTSYYVDANSTSRMGTINADVLYSYGNVTAYSDERLKKDWETLPTNFVEELAKIKSGTYTRIDSGERQVGVGAQSLQAILKEAVSEKEEYLGVHYGNTAMVSAVELAKEVVKLKELLTKQQIQIEELKSLVNKLIGS